MRRPDFITFTGIDDHTCTAGMFALAQRYPIEWGVLFSRDRQGIDPRYPGGEAQSRFLWCLPALRMSAHLCGEHSRNIMDGLPIKPPVDFGFFQRIQVNYHDPIPARIIEFRSGWGRMRCIAQTRTEALAFPRDTSVDWLCDSSGGRGIAPTSWPLHPGGDRLVGYAGGLNADNVGEALHRINSAGPFWIDMESGVRTDNRFDLRLCDRVCQAVYG